MAEQVYLGNKIRRLRSGAGWTQAHLARQLEISASYLNLIEHNKRSLTMPLLVRLAELFECDLDELAADDESAVLAELREIFADAVFGPDSPEPGDARALATHAPRAAQALLTLYRAYKTVHDSAEALAARFADGSSVTTPSSRLPLEEVADFIDEHRNYFAPLERAAEKLWSTADLQADGLSRGLVDHLRTKHRVRVRVVASGQLDGAVRRFAPDDRTLWLSEMLPHASLVFQLAHQIALLAARDEIDAIVAASSLRAASARQLATIALANYFAGATIMPYREFAAAARSSRHDIEVLQRRFGVSFEQACHRLATLNDPDEPGIPFHFVRLDLAGNISKHYGGSGIRIARYSGACPRWNVHSAFMTPGQIQTQLSRMTDGAVYFCIARTVRKTGGGHPTPPRDLAVGLGCRVEHAAELVYADGIDLDSPEAAVPVGVSCRACERTDCPQRAVPPPHQRIEVDTNRRGLSLY